MKMWKRQNNVHELDKSQVIFWVLTNFLATFSLIETVTNCEL